MASTTAVYARIDTELKNQAEEILSKLGISPSSAIQMLYRQVVNDRAFPFTPHLTERRPLFLDELTDEELYAELKKGLDSMERGDTLTMDEVDAMLADEFGL
jgi:addiction module RelB/DinJ family antitoxin